MLQPLSLASLLFTGLVLVIVTTISAPMVVYAANIKGTPGDDILNGTPKTDIIKGFEGNDKLFGEAGNDGLDGGRGDDEMYGGDGKDRIKDGNDEPPGDEADYGNKVYGGSGNDNIDVGIDQMRSDFYYVYGEDGSDYIKVVSNADIHGGSGNDIVYCTALNECIINGDGGDDEIHAEILDVGSSVSGGSGNDKLYVKAGGGFQSGDDGNDYILVIGGGGDLHGGEGDDVLEASAGGNFYNGGPGADTFNCSPGTGDRVEDYNPEEGDKIVNIEDCETVEGT
jgi:Ca2+-binding RTX toxin-like protein